MRRHGVDLSLLGVAAVWGSSYLAAKVAVGAAPVLDVLFLRYAIAAAASATLVWGLGRSRPSSDELRAGAVLGLTQAAVLLLETFGVAGTSAAHAGVLISLTILVTPMLEAVGGERLPGRFLVAAAVCVAGVALLLVGPGWAAPRRGDVLVLAAALVRGGHVVLVGRLTADRTGAPPMRALHLTLVQTVVGSALCLPVAGPSLVRGSAAQAGAGFWATVAYLALACSLFAFLAQTRAVQRTSASRASLLLGTEPVWAVGTALALGGQSLTLALLVGAGLVVGGTYWGQAVERHHRHSRRSGRKTSDDVPRQLRPTDRPAAAA